MPAPQFTVNTSRYDPYKNFNFLVYFSQSTTPVAGVNKVSQLHRSSTPVPYQQSGDAIIRQGLSRVKYDPISLERGITHDKDFETWANAAQVLDKGVPTQSLKNLRKDLRIDFLNEAGQPVHRFLIYRCWVSAFVGLPALDAGGAAIAIEHIDIVHEGWEHDLSLNEPTEI